MLAEDFEDELTCPVCLMLFTDPRTLPCGNSHNVCLECAKGLWKNLDPSFGNCVTCPVCRAPCLANDGVERLPLNLALRNMVDKLEAAQNAKGGSVKKANAKRKYKCDVCEKKPAVMECVTCVVKYCDACLETCHPKERAVFKAHVVAPMEPVSGRECDVHEGQALAFFCTQCGVMVCAHCLLMGTHIEHPRVSLHTAVTDRKAQLIAAMETLESKHAVVHDFTQRADAAMQTLSESCAQVRAEVETECMDMQLLVKGLQHRLLEVVDRHEREKRATVMCQLEGQRQRLSVWGAMIDRAKQVMQNEDGAVYLDVDTHKLDKQLRGAADASLAPPKLANVALGLTLTISQLKESVGNMHFTEYLVPPAPSEVVCVECTMSSLLLSWTCDTREGDPCTFTVQQSPLAVSSEATVDSEDAWVEMYSGKLRSCTAVGLQERTSYRFRISGSNSSGTGTWSKIHVFTTGVPKAPENLMLLERTHRSLGLAWGAEPSLRTRHCTYVVEVKGGDKDEGGNADQTDDWMEIYSGPFRTCVAADLSPATAYRVRVCAVNASGRGPYCQIVALETLGQSAQEKSDEAKAATQQQQQAAEASRPEDYAEQSLNAPPSGQEDQGVENAVAASTGNSPAEEEMVRLLTE